MHLNINLGRTRQPHFHGPGRHGGGQMGNMLRMMMQMMQQMMQMMMGQGSGHCQMGRPNFGGGCHGGFPQGGGGQGGHCGGNPLGNFLGGGGGGFQVPHHHHGGSGGGCHGGHHHGGVHGGHHNHGMHAPPSGHWQQSGQGGQLGGRLPGPLQRHAGAFEHYGKKYGVDPKFLAAISMLETGSGTSKAFKYKNNAMGVSNRSGPIAFGSVEQSIERMARVLAKKDGPYRGKRTIGQIAGVYCPVGAGNDVNGTNHHWPRMVSKFYTQLGGNPSAAVKG